LTGDDSTDLSLIQRIRQNEPGAWRDLHRWIGQTVLYWCRRLGLERKEDREDVSQEVFLAVHHSIGNFRKESPGDRFRNWLFQITSRKVCDHFRRRPRTIQAEQQALESALAEQTRALEQEESQDSAGGARLLLHAALELVRKQVEERTWQACWQTVVEERSAPEVAATLGMTPQAVRKAKSRVLRQLRTEFKDLL
jgi:RNA polymerase sigma-70 factor, ECF subfamily